MNPEVSQVGPFDRWPSGEGFDHYFGFMAADADNYRSLVWRDHYPIEDWMDKPGYHWSEAMAVSPDHRYSRAAAAEGSTRPVPVAVAEACA